MAKKDFSILLEPATQSTIDAKDVALVTDIYSIGQQIKNIVLSNKLERPFNPTVGIDVDSTNLATGGNFVLLQYSAKITAAVNALVRSITNVSTSISKQPSQLIVTVKFDYITKTQNFSGNFVTVTVNTL